MADPKVNPNALGAPAEGFGQTVSFAFDARGVTPALQLQTGTPHGVGAQGASRAQLQDTREAYKPVAKDGTADLLLRVAGDLLGPELERHKNEQFVSGMQRAMQGEAVADLQAEQPWYSRIFGDTPAIEGARAYQVSAKVNEVVAQESANMDKLKAMSPADAAKHFSGLFNKHMTGDAMTDSLMTKAMVEQLPGLMKAQAKANYGHVQKVASDSMSRNMSTGAAALQQAGQMYAEDTINEKDWAVRKQAYLASILPPDGINEENYGKTLVANLRRAAENGQFHAITAVYESGGAAALTPEQYNSVHAAVMSAATKHRNDYAFQYTDAIAQLKSDAAALPEGHTPESIVDRANKMNDAYRKVSGSPVGLFSSDEVANMGKAAVDHIKQEKVAAIRRAEILADRNANAADKDKAKAETAARVSRLVANGDPHLAVREPGVSKDDVDLEFMAQFKSNPVSGTKVLRDSWIRGDGYVNGILKAELAAPLRNAESRDLPTNEARRAIDNFQALRDGAGGLPLAQAYYEGYAPKIERFLRMTEGAPDGANDSRAWVAAFRGDGLEKREPLEKAAAVGLAKAVAAKTTGLLPQWMGGDGLRHDAIAMLTQIAKPATEDWRGVGGVTDEQAVGNGVAAAIVSRKVELLGGFAIDRSNVESKMPTLRELAQPTSADFVRADRAGATVPKGSEDDYFKEFIKTKTEHMDMDGSVRMHYMGKEGGTEQFLGSVQGKDGGVKIFRFSADEWRDFASKTTLAITAKPAKPWYAAGPAITYQDTPQARAIYGSRNAKAELQAELDAKARKRNQP